MLECLPLTGLSKLGERPEAYPRVGHLTGASLRRTPAFLPTNRLGWEGLTGTNTSLNQTFVNLRCKKCFSIGPWWRRKERIFRTAAQSSQDGRHIDLGHRKSLLEKF